MMSFTRYILKSAIMFALTFVLIGCANNNLQKPSIDKLQIAKHVLLNTSDEELVKYYKDFAQHDAIMKSATVTNLEKEASQKKLQLSIISLFKEANKEDNKKSNAELEQERLLAISDMIVIGFETDANNKNKNKKVLEKEILDKIFSLPTNRAARVIRMIIKDML